MNSLLIEISPEIGIGISSLGSSEIPFSELGFFDDDVCGNVDVVLASDTTRKKVKRAP